MQIPMIISIWDDNYGISVSSEYQTTKGDISEVLKGFQKDKNSNGFEMFKVKGWDYVELMKTYQKAEEICRKNHIPVIIHVNELTQPLGHSTSGSHERYKSKDRLKWEKEYDCILKMREWILENKLINENELEKIEIESKDEVRKARSNAKSNSLKEIIGNIKNFNELLEKNIDFKNQNISSILNSLNEIKEPSKKDLFSSVNKIIRELQIIKNSSSNILADWLYKLKEKPWSIHF